MDGAVVEAGKLYKLELDLRDGTAATKEFQFYFDDGAAQYGPVITSPAAFLSYFCVFECMTSTDAAKVGVRIIDNLAGSNLEIRRFSCYEITPCCTNNDALGPSYWYKDVTLDLYREHSGGNTRAGSFYSLKSVPSAQNDFGYWPIIYNRPEHLARFAGRTVTFRVWVKSAVANDFRLVIFDNGVWYRSGFHSGGGDFEWLQITRTPIATTFFAVGWRHESVTPGIAYLSQPMLTFGSLAVEDDYMPMPTETVDCEQNILLANYTASGVPTDAVINLETESDGKIPKVCAAVHLNLLGQNSATDKYLRLLSEAGGVNGPRIEDSVVAAKLLSASGRQVCNEDGNIYIDVEDANWSNVTIEISAVDIK